MNLLSKITLTCLPLLAVDTRAHALWAEPSEGGYKVFFGEPGEGLREKKAEFSKVGPVKALDVSGKEAKGTQGEDHIFVKAAPGGLSVSASDVPLHGEGNEALRVFFYAHSGEVGKKVAPTKGAALEILPEGKDSVTFTLLKGGKPFTDGKLEMFAPGGWNRSFTPDAQGKVKLETPWAGQYVLEATSMDETAGKLGDKPFKGTYHAATFSFVKK
jgi:hypothetical protein